MSFFGLNGPFLGPFCPNKGKYFSTYMDAQLHGKFQKKLMSQFLGKNVTNGRTNGRTNGQAWFYRTLSSYVGGPISEKDIDVIRVGWSI